MNVGYMPPQGRFDIDAVNASLESRLGYPAYAYWDFFLDSRAAELLHDDVSQDRLRDLGLIWDAYAFAIFHEGTEF